MSDTEQAFEAWWATQVTPPDDQRNWKHPMDKETRQRSEALVGMAKMWARKGWMAALGDGGKEG